MLAGVRVQRRLLRRTRLVVVAALLALPVGLVVLRLVGPSLLATPVGEWHASTPWDPWQPTRGHVFASIGRQGLTVSRAEFPSSVGPAMSDEWLGICVGRSGYGDGRGNDGVVRFLLVRWPTLHVVTALPACAIVGRWLLKKRPRAGACPNCGYDLRATPNRCPECGRLPGTLDVR